MKNFKLSLIALLGLPTLILAQDLYVSPTSYMYVQDEVVFVTDDVQLESADSFIYLRDGAQLIQDNNTKNSDLGELSVYQQGTVGVFEYNYWCSPVGVGTNGTTGDVNFDVTNFHSPDSGAINEINSTTFSISTSGFNSTNTEIKTYWLWQVLNAYSYNDWVSIRYYPASVETGAGFTMKGDPGADRIIDFRGRPNNGDLSIDVDWDGSSVAVNYDGLAGNQVESLIGNPYPSTMDLKMFLINANNQADLESAIYFWQQKVNSSHYLADYEGGYGMWVPGTLLDLNDHGSFTAATFVNYEIGSIVGETGITGTGTGTAYGAPYSRRYAAIGQGFMVRSLPGIQNGNAEINNSMRLYVKDTPGNVDVFGKSSQSNNEEDNKIIAMSHNGLDYSDIINNPTIIPEIKIHTKINDSYYRESLLAFRANTNTSYQANSDGKIAQKLASDTYFIADNNELSIKSIQYNIDAKIPFGMLAENNQSTYSVTIYSTEDIADSVEIFMHDKLNDTYTNIRNGTFEITLDVGTHNDRFEVVFKDASKEANDELIITEAEITGSFDVFQNNTNNQLVIKNPKSYIVKSFTMYDVTGKLIYNKHNLGNDTEYTFPTNTLSSGTYITKITTDQNFEITKKVIINN
nr:MAG: hypothetical protein COA88_10775 [Kordia sp.]